MQAYGLVGYSLFIAWTFFLLSAVKLQQAEGSWPVAVDSTSAATGHAECIVQECPGARSAD